MQQRRPALINKAFNQYLGASVLTVAATQIANIVDASIVGNLIGSEGLAAVNLSKPVLQAFFAVSCLYVPSSTILAGIAVGKGDKTRANKLFTFSLLTSLILGLLFTAGALLAFNPLSTLLCASDNLRGMTNSFLHVTVLSAIPQLMMYTFHQFVTMDGSPKIVSRAVIVGNVFNIFFDIIFIKYCGWGIAGAAWATFIMYIVCILMTIPHFRKKDSLRPSRPRRGDIEYGQVLSFGIPLFLSTVLLSVQYVGNNRIASNYLGDGGLIALAVCLQLFAFSMIFLTGTLRTIQPVGSILKGLGDDRGMVFLVRKAYKFLAVCLAVYAAAIVFFPAQISQMLGATNEASLPIILKALPLFSLNIIMQALLYNLMPVFQLYGHKKLALFLSVSQTLFPMFGFWALEGGWLGFFLGQVAVAVVILITTAVIRSRNKSLMPLLLIPENDVKQVYDVTVDTTIEALGESTQELKAFLQSQGLEKEKAVRYVLCVEELLKNIIQHGHARYVDIRATDSVITIHDDGKPFNPIEYRTDGEGLGLKIVHGFGLKTKYDFRFNQNMITLLVE